MRKRSLLSQVLAANMLLICAAIFVASLASGLDLSIADQRRSFLIMALAIVLTLTVNMWLLGRRFTPLEHVIETMEKVDLSRPRANLPVSLDGVGETLEVQRIEQAFLRMLERLEAERRRSSLVALRAQEEERTRVARDLHDEVNQALTGVLLHLEAAREKAPPELVQELAETRTLANQAMDELLSLARQLRPTALDDLGLIAALDGLVSEYARRTGIDVSFDAEGADVADLAGEVQLVIYRVSQEALANAARHSGATSVRVRLASTPEGVELEVADDGSGFAFAQADRGLGLAGMRERAMLVDGDLSIESGPGRGTKVRLRI